MNSTQSNNQNFNKTESLPYIYSIPYPVFTDSSISSSAKLHFALLSGLSVKEGYCWATDEYLAEKQNCTDRQIKTWHKELEDAGHITRVIKNYPYIAKDGRQLWKKRRKIYVSPGFSKKVSDSEENFPINDGEENFPIIENIKQEEASKAKKTNEYDIPKEDPPPDKLPAASFQKDETKHPKQKAKQPMPEKSKQAFLDMGFPPENLNSLHAANGYSEEQYALAAAHLKGRANLASVGIIKACIDEKWYTEPTKESAQDCNKSLVAKELGSGRVLVQGTSGNFVIEPLNKELDFCCKSHPGGSACFNYDLPNFRQKVKDFIDKCGLTNSLKQNNLLDSFT